MGRPTKAGFEFVLSVVIEVHGHKLHAGNAGDDRVDGAVVRDSPGII